MALNQLLYPGSPEATKILADATTARENIILQSNNFDTTWLVNANTSVAVTAETLAPDGTATAWKVYDNNLGGTGQNLLSQTITVDVSSQYTVSCWVKAAGLEAFYFEWDNFVTPASNARQAFNIARKQRMALAQDAVEVYVSRNGWLRCSATWTTDVAQTTGTLRVGPRELTTIQNDQDNTSSMYIWGFQVEKAAASSSYVPTTTAAATSSTITLSGNFRDDIHAALEFLTGTTGSLDDLYKRYQEYVGGQ